MKILASNRKALYSYHIIETWQAGIVLKGTEIKSLRESQCSIAEAWVKLINNEAFLIGATIPPYSQAKEAWKTHDPNRDRKLLLNRKELNRIDKELSPGLTLIPLDIHLNEHNFAKVKLALCKGKKNYDKRQALKERDSRRYGDE
jgi:SsrA-binding protein